MRAYMKDPEFRKRKSEANIKYQERLNPNAEVRVFLEYPTDWALMTEEDKISQIGEIL